MAKALATLLQGALDFAGLFPPAKLDMAAAVANYLAYRHGPERWILGRFACSAGHLGELLDELGNDKEERAVAVTVIGQASHDRHSWEVAREQDARAMNDFLKRADRRAEIEAYEVRLPSHDQLERHLDELRGFDGVDVFVELPWDGPVRDSIALIAESEFAGAKARTGGEYVPTAEQLAAFIHSAVNAEVPFKLTAGLHHAYPTGGEHGLVSVFGGAALTFAEDLSSKELHQVLEAPAAAWTFDDGVRCLDYYAAPEDIEEMRELFAAVGSCSVEEPLEELESLGFVRG